MYRLLARSQDSTVHSRPSSLAGSSVFIVGGGPAGLAAAIALSRKGFCVTVADGAKMPIEKVCGEGILPEGLATLRGLGIDVPLEKGFAFRGLRFVSGSQSADAKFPHAPGLGLRRTILHAAMVDAALRGGVTLHWSTPVRGISRDGVVSWPGASIRPHWIIAADGAASRVRRWAGLQTRHMRNRRFAFRRHYDVAPWSDYVEVYWGKSCQFYVTPVGDSEIGVVFLSANPDLRMDEALAQFPRLTARLKPARITTSERGGITGTWIHPRVTRGNVALVGDAAGMVDAISGEGLRLAFQQSLALADALAANDPSHYQREHRRIMRRPRAMVRLMLAMQSSPALQRRTLRILSCDPQLFQRFLAVHTGSASPVHLASTGARFSWRLLAEAF